ncbi:PAS domain-containing hybrid sensor histidine kinase/response regulator [Candidatus Magnetaquicoccus inordinatus]|uniref:PAS domain-containing hybrid sensor histidine kinase/response regulator n=1 Tax=Candidatus Magnetaquicoccus inordinatus TaxID=2496818 RepID=UPI00102C87FE|nr:PAS domain-containing hybrid sensor histidine kinase/response regulator [Candidatus Magnetaquicoccus inordinatus]
MKIFTNIPSARTPLLVGIMVFLTLVVIIASFYLTQKEKLKNELQIQLLGIGNLKVDQINAWVEQYYRDGVLFKQSSLLSHTLQQWMVSADFPEKLPWEISTQLSSRKKLMNYAEIAVVSAEGETLFSTSEESVHALDKEEKNLVQHAFVSGEILFSAIHAVKNRSGNFFMEMLVPLSVADKERAIIGCVVILSIDVQKFLFPLVNYWPFPSSSAESLLVAREGNDVLFLNKPRHWPGEPLSLHLPIPSGESRIPAVRGMMGEKGIMEGMDYRGVPVLAAAIPLARLPWIMIAKMDQEEAYAWLSFQTWSFLFSGIATLLLTLLWWVYSIKNEMQKVMDRLNLSQRIALMGCWDWDPHRDQESWSRELFTLFALDACQTTGNRLLFQNFIHPEERQHIVREFHDLLAHATTFGREFRIIRQDGKVRFVLEKGYIFRDHRGKIYRVLGVLTDISERKSAEESLRIAKSEAEEANHAKEIFLANMSHELRTPLNAIVTLSELALQAHSASIKQDYIEKIQNSAKMMSGIIQDVLDFFKIRSGRFELEHLPFYLEDLLANLATILGVTNKKRLRVLFQVAEPMPRYLRGDSLRLGQILLNLISNAIKFTQHGFVLLSVEVAERGSDKVLLCFTITDSGCGITEAQMQRIFQPFAQGDNSIARRFGGTGLGLSISQKLVDLMNGTLQGRSEPGLGSTFSFSITLDLLADPQPAEEPFSLVGLPVLLVDDNPPYRQILVEMLTSCGMVVQVLEEMADLYRQLEQWQAECCPLALLFWDKEQYAPLQVLCNRFPAGSFLKYILLSAGGSKDADELVHARNLDRLLVYPFTATMLKDALLQVIGNRPRAAVFELSEQSPAFVGARILVVDDMEINRLLAQDLLQKEGCQVTLAEDGCEAVALLEQQPFDLLFMDLQMARMGGLEATRQIRKLPGMAALPIISMTASNSAGDRQSCLDSGMNDHMLKPLNAQVLHKMLCQWLTNGEVKQAPEGVARKDMQRSTALLSANLPAFDVAMGLSTVIGNPLLYRILLRKFRQSNLQTAARVYNALLAGDHPQAKELLHKVVGVVGHLGGHSLMRAARSLEKGLSHHGTPLDESLMAKFTSFQSSLEEALTQLRLLDEAEADADCTLLPLLPAQEERIAAAQLLETLVLQIAAQNVMEGISSVERLQQHLAGSQMVTEAELLMEQLFYFAWEQAQQTLLRMQQALGKSL